MYNYINGNATITLDDDGTRVIQCEGDLKLDYPLNLDIKVSEGCSLGSDCKAENGYCSECGEKAMVNGREADYDELKDLLYGLPKWMEISVRSNIVTLGLMKFLSWCKNQDFLLSLNINQYHVKPYAKQITQLLINGSLKSVHISVRDITAFNDVPIKIRTNPKTVVKLHMGTDEPLDIKYLTKESKVKHIQVQGFKKSRLDYDEEEVNENIAYWKAYIGPYLGKTFLSFDNLALDQIEIKKFFHDDSWKMFYQESECLYIDAVNQMIAEDATSILKLPWRETSIRHYYQRTKTSLKE